MEHWNRFKKLFCDNAYAILQVKDTVENFPFLSHAKLSWLDNRGIALLPANYECVWADNFPWPDGDISGKLEEIFYVFNSNMPQDFNGRFMCVSDIIVVRKNGKESYHYVNPIGFKELENFRFDEFEG